MNESWREREWRRVSSMAGLTPDDSIMPDPDGAKISKDTNPWWKTGYSAIGKKEEKI